jgi:hypothetical protein
MPTQFSSINSLDALPYSTATPSNPELSTGDVYAWAVIQTAEINDATLSVLPITLFLSVRVLVIARAF